VSAATVPTITARFFGSGVRVTWYTITGDTPTELQASIERNGPYHRWLGGSAEAMTKPRIQPRFALRWDGAGGCRIVARANPAIRTTFTIILPRWRPPRSASPSTVRWWTDELLRAARHERTHVRITSAASRKANRVLASSTCTDWERRQKAVWRQARRDNCRFDMKEYGEASGLTMTACMSQ
jgi:predicted secreted Zn-dependent protease